MATTIATASGSLSSLELYARTLVPSFMDGVEGVELIHTKDRGRTLIARRAYKRDDIIFTETPILMSSDLVDACVSCSPVTQANQLSTRHLPNECPWLTNKDDGGAALLPLALALNDIARQTQVSVPNLRLLFAAIRALSIDIDEWKSMPPPEMVKPSTSTATASPATETKQSPPSSSSSVLALAQRCSMLFHLQADHIIEAPNTETSLPASSDNHILPFLPTIPTLFTLQPLTSLRPLARQCLAAARAVHALLPFDSHPSSSSASKPSTRSLWLNQNILTVDRLTHLLVAFETNGHAMNGIKGKGISPMFAMLEHSCAPSCYFSTSRTNTQMDIIALR
jgi:hypothetical protein